MAITYDEVRAPRRFRHTPLAVIEQQLATGQKCCHRCQVTQPLGEFQKGARFRDGLQPWCKSCFKEVRATRYRTQRQHTLEQNKDWALRNPERRRALNVVKSNNRRARLATASGFASADQVAARRAMYGSRCWMCDAESATDMDHVIPLADGGSNWASNLRPACRSCNASKGARKGVI